MAEAAAPPPSKKQKSSKSGKKEEEPSAVVSEVAGLKPSHIDRDAYMLVYQKVKPAHGAGGAAAEVRYCSIHIIKRIPFVCAHSLLTIADYC